MKFMRRGNAGYELPMVEIEGKSYDASPVGDFDQEFWASSGPQKLREFADEGILTRVTLDEEVRYGSPVAETSTILCIGQNFAAHAAESGAPLPDSPVVFLKTVNTITGPHDEVILAKDSKKTDWEVELGFIVSSSASYCKSVEEAAQHIGGFILANDLSERAFQFEASGGQWSKGKCSPGYMPLGPWIVTADEFDPSDVELRSWVNGELRQNSSTSDMIFSCAEIVKDLSQYMQLEPGDVISTGTPAGVAFSGRFPYIKAGDVVEVAIGGLGSQRHMFRAWDGG